MFCAGARRFSGVTLHERADILRQTLGLNRGSGHVENSQYGVDGTPRHRSSIVSCRVEFASFAYADGQSSGVIVNARPSYCPRSRSRFGHCSFCYLGYLLGILFLPRRIQWFVTTTPAPKTSLIWPLRCERRRFRVFPLRSRSHPYFRSQLCSDQRCLEPRQILGIQGTLMPCGK